MRMQAIKRVVAGVCIGGGALFIVYAAYQQKAEMDARQASATAGGFQSVADYEAARDLGASSHAEWQAKIAEQQARKDEESARAQREWDAGAPQRAKDAETRRKREDTEREARRLPQERASMAFKTWSVGGFGAVGLMTFTIKNDNDYAIKDFGITCWFHGASGTKLGDRAHVLFDLVKAKSSRTFKEVNIGLIPAQAAKAGCDLVSAMRA